MFESEFGRQFNKISYRLIGCGLQSSCEVFGCFYVIREQSWIRQAGSPEFKISSPSCGFILNCQNCEGSTLEKNPWGQLAPKVLDFGRQHKVFRRPKFLALRANNFSLSISTVRTLYPQER